MALAGVFCAACGRTANPIRESPDEQAEKRAAWLGASAAELRGGSNEERRFTGSEAVVYRLTLAAGEALHVTLDQRGVDLVAELRDSAGQPLVSVDSPNGDQGPEHVFFVAEGAGSYGLVIRSFGGRQGRFSIRRDSRSATDLDRWRAEACRTVSEADADVARSGASFRRAAVRRYADAIELWQRTEEVYQQALTETKLGKVLYSLGKLRSAAEHWQRSLTLLNGLGIASQDAALLNDSGMAYERLGELDRARGTFERARASSRRLGNRREETVAINNLGILEQDQGEPWQALSLLDEALAGWRSLDDAVGEAATLHNLGTLYTVLGQLPEARGALAEALKRYRLAGRPRDEAATLMALGWVRFLQGDVPGARADLSRSLDLRRSTGDRRGEAVSLDRLGTLSRENRELNRAVKEYRQALSIMVEIYDAQTRASVLSNLGATLTLRGDPIAGRRCQTEALQLVAAARQPSAEAYVRFRRASAARELGDLNAAWNDMREAIPRLEAIRERAVSDDFRMTYFDSVHEQYEMAVDLLMELHAREPQGGFDRRAFEMAERARARGLLDLVQQEHARHAIERLAVGSERLRRLDEELRSAERRVSELVERGGVEALQAHEEARIRRLLRQRDKLLMDQEGAWREPRLSAQPLSAADIQRRVLDTDTVLLVYALGEKRSFVWAVSQRKIESAVLPPRALLEAGAVRLHTLLGRSTLGATKTQTELTARELSRLLLGKVAHRLAGQRLAVVPDGALAYVPFGALPDPAADDLPLLARHEVIVVPSASVLAAIRARAAARPAPPQLLAVVADPVFSRDDPRLQPDGAPGVPAGDGVGDQPGALAFRSARSLGLPGLARLPFTGREAASILALVPRAERLAATGFAASPALLSGGRLEGFRIVHLATHSLVHPGAPDLSGVVLSLVDEHGRPQPGFLRSYQILSLHLPADLVVLSGCRTGLGQRLNGEGLVGLTQSFFHAGASRLVVSLWDVDDRATASLMAMFYREMLVGGRSPAAALRAAQLALRQDHRWSTPGHWAGFVLQGEWR